MGSRLPESHEDVSGWRLEQACPSARRRSSGRLSTTPNERLWQFHRGRGPCRYAGNAAQRRHRQRYPQDSGQVSTPALNGDRRRAPVAVDTCRPPTAIPCGAAGRRSKNSVDCVARGSGFPVPRGLLSNIAGPAEGKRDNSSLNYPGGSPGEGKSVPKSLATRHTRPGFPSFHHQSSQSAAGLTKPGL